MLSVSVLFRSQLKPLKYIHFNAAFGKLSLKKSVVQAQKRFPFCLPEWMSNSYNLISVL